MRIHYSVVLYLALLVNLSAWARGEPNKLQQYLSKRMQFVNEQLNQPQNLRASRNAVSTFELDDPKIAILENKTSAYAFSMFGDNYALTDDDLYALEQQSAGENQMWTHLLRFPRDGRQIVQVKTIDFEETAFMLVSYESGLSHLYRFSRGFQNSTQLPEPAQTITTHDEVTDTLMFVKDSALYLLIAGNINNRSLVPLSLYKWEESFFDKIEEVHLEYVVGMLNFAYADSEVIILLRNNNRNTLVYEFNERRLSKVQILDEVSHGTSAITFSHENKTYLIINDAITSSALYVWREFEFVLLEKFDEGKRSREVFVAHLGNTTTLIVFTLEDEMHVSSIAQDRLQYLKDRRFEASYKKMLSVKTVKYDDEDTLHFIGLTENNDLHIALIPFEFDNVIIESRLDEGNGLAECMQSLDTILEDLASAKQYRQSGSEAVDGTPRVGNRDSATQAAFVGSQPRPDRLVQLKLSPEMQNGLECVQEMLPLLEDLAKRLQPTFLTHRNTIFGNVIVPGSLSVETLATKDVNLGSLNGVAWTPDQWLSYTKNQTISGSYHIRSLRGNKLTATASVLLQNLTRFDAPVEVQNLNVNRLTVNNLNVERINDILIDDVYLKNSTEPVTGEKTFKSINTNDAIIKFLNEKEASNVVKLMGNSETATYDLAENAKVVNLNAENINGVNWKTFIESVFLIGENQTIDGNITIANLIAKNLQTKFLSNHDAGNLLTAATPQTVNSVLRFKSVQAKNVNAEKINGLNFEKEVVVTSPESNVTVSGPVSMKHVKITEELYVNCTMQEFVDRYLEGEFLQIYSDKIRIHGDLNVHSVDLLDSAKLHIDGNEFNRENFNDYWLKTTNQEIPLHFEAQNGISTPHLNVNLLNDVPIGNYMVNNNAAPLSERTTYVFENVTVTGNVIVNKTNHHYPDLALLDKLAVKLDGSYVLKGNKTFVGTVEIANLTTDTINKIPSTDLLTQSSANVDGSKTFKKVVAKSATANHLLASKINSISLETIRNDTVFINAPNTLANVNFKNASVENLVAVKINNKLLDDYVDELDKIHNQTQLNLLMVRGDISIGKLTDVRTMNNIDMHELLNAINGDESAPIKTVVTFDGNVHVRELLVSKINDVDVEPLLNKLYYRVWPQNVTARHSFNVIHSPNIVTPFINNVNTINLIDVTNDQTQLLKLDNELVLINSKFDQLDIESDYLNCNFANMVSSLHDVPKRAWKAVQVNDATISDDTGPISALLEHAVNGMKDNFINAPISVANVIGENVFVANGLINDVNVEEIVNDALVINEPHQVITGFKEFAKLSASEAAVYGTAQVPLINGVEFLALNASIIARQDAGEIFVNGRKTLFGGMEAHSFKTPVALEVQPENLVSFSDLRTIPKCTFVDLTVLNDMHIGTTNNVDFAQFLEKRLLLKNGHDQVTNATYFFSDVVLDGKTTIDSINGIPMDEVVFDEGTVEIHGTKRFMQKFNVLDTLSVVEMNGLDLQNMYEDSAMPEESVIFRENMMITKPSEINGKIHAKSINGVPMDTINEYLHSENTRIRAEIVEHVMTDIGKLVTSNIEGIKKLPEQYMYLENSDEIQLEINNTLGAKMIPHRSYGVMAHVYTSEPGAQCGLPDSCTCINQNSVRIGNDYSVNIIENKYSQRVFTFETSDLNLYVITTTNSNSDKCSHNDSKSLEYTSITWTLKRNDKNTRKSYNFQEPITGYIADVEFFEFDGHVYVVLAKQYDPDRKTHRVDSTILQISKDFTHIEHVQNLRTNGANKLHVFYTAQGVNLVIASNGGTSSDPCAADIYQLQAGDKIMKLLRSIPSNSECSSITSLVFNEDSFVVLAYANYPLQILKYNNGYNSYYIHESLLQGEAIVSVSRFFVPGAGRSDAYLTAVTDKNRFYVFSYNYLLDWKMETSSYMEGINALVPVYLDRSRQLLFASSTLKSALFKIVKQSVN